MSEPLRVEAGGKPGESVVWIGTGLLADADRYLVSRSGRFLLVSNAASRSLTEPLRRVLSGRLLADVEIDDREVAKRLSTVEKVVDAALAAGVRRDDALIAVGGGVVSDIAGFAASILLRGIEWNAVPTTTGSMADAAIGGKTGVDHAAGKNLLGSFHPPRAIVVDASTLETLPERDYRAGLVEAFKSAWISDAELAARAERDLSALLGRERRSLFDLLAGSIRIKVEIVGSDPREQGRRRLLNFGHTLGHAFEAAGDYRLRHGEAVAWGIAGALAISRERAGLSEATARRLRTVLAGLGPFPEPVRDPALLAPLLSRDKKSTVRGIAGVLLEDVGRARVENAIPLEVWIEAAQRASLSPTG